LPRGDSIGVPNINCRLLSPTTYRNYRYSLTKLTKGGEEDHRPLVPLSACAAGVQNTRSAGVLSARGAGLLSARGAGVQSTRGAGVLSARGAGVLSARGAGVLSARGAGVLSARGAGGLSARAAAGAIQPRRRGNRKRKSRAARGYDDDFIVYEEEEEEEEENWSPGDNSPDANFRGKFKKNNKKGSIKKDERNQCLGLPDPLVRGTDPAQDPDPSLFS
jgi:hypothetical protein